MLLILARPLTLWRGVLAASMVLCVAVILAVPALRDFYALQLPDTDVAAAALGVAAGAVVILESGWRITRFVAHRRGGIEPGPVAA